MNRREIFRKIVLEENKMIRRILMEAEMSDDELLENLDGFMGDAATYEDEADARKIDKVYLMVKNRILGNIPPDAKKDTQLVKALDGILGHYASTWLEDEQDIKYVDKIFIRVKKKILGQ